MTAPATFKAAADAGAVPAVPIVSREHWQVPAYAVTFYSARSLPWCVVVPVINEGERIGRLLARMAALGIPRIADILIVDGGSIDGSLDVARLQAQGVRGLLVKTGPGKLSAQLRCAYAFAMDQGYEGVVTIDGNDKDDPQPIAQFIGAMRDGVDFVQASRFVPGGVAENTPLVRTLAIRLLHAPLLSLFSGQRWTDTTQGFRAYRRAVLIDPRLAVFRDIFVCYELLAYLSCRVPQLGYRCKELPTTRRYPASGKVPTKISGLRPLIDLMKTLIRACMGGFNPTASK